MVAWLFSAEVPLGGRAHERRRAGGALTEADRAITVGRLGASISSGALRLFSTKMKNSEKSLRLKGVCLEAAKV